MAITGTGTAAPTTSGVLRAEWRSVLTTMRLMSGGRLVQPRRWVGADLRFADGSTSVVFRETAVDDGLAERPALLVVAFRLRLVRRWRWPHAAFRAGSVVNTLLFAGFPGFRSKLWLTDPRTGVYRGVYEWDGADRAVAYAEALTRVLGLVSVPGTVRYRVVAAVRRDDFLREPRPLAAGEGPGETDAWWRLARPVARAA